MTATMGFLHKFSIISMSILLLNTGIHAASGDWAVDANGDWSNGANWTSNPAFPDGATDVAGFPSIIGAIRTINVDGTFDVLTIAFSNNLIYLLENGTLNIHESITQTGTSVGNLRATAILVNDVTIDVSGAASVVLADISGAGGIIKEGTGTLIFGTGATGAATSTYGGTTTVNNGTLTITKNSGFVGISGDLVLNSGSLIFGNINPFAFYFSTTTNATINGGSLIMNTNSETFASLTFNGGTITQNGGISLTSTGTALTMRNTTLSGSVSLTGGSGGDVVFDSTNNGTATISANLSLGSVTRTFNIANGAAATDMTITGVISGTGGLTKTTGAGFLNFGGGTANTYSGLTTVSTGTLSLGKTAGVNAIAGDVAIDGTGTLFLTNANQIANTSSMTLSAGTFDLNNNADTISSLTFSGGTVTNNGSSLSLQSTGTALTIGNGLSLPGQLNLTGGSGGSIVYNGGAATATLEAIGLGSATRIFDVAAGVDPGLNITGAITETSTAGLTKNSGGILALNGASTYTGTTTINAGTLRLVGGASTLGSSSPLTINGGSFVIAAGAGTKTIGALNGGGSGITLNDNTINIPSGNFTGDITGTGDLNKTTGGTLTLSGATTLTGGTATAQAGTLIIDGSLTAAAFNVDSGATLGGTGAITADFVANSGSIVAPGASIGTLTVTGAYTQSTGSTLLMEIDPDGNSDLLRVIGGVVTIEPGATLELDPLPGIYLPGTMYTLIDADVPIVGQFDTVVFSAPAGLQATFSQNSNLVLTLIAVGGFVELSNLVTGNAQQVAFCFDNQEILPGTDLETVAIALQPLTSNLPLLQNALDQMQPAIFGALNVIEESQAVLMQSTISHRLEAWGNGGCGDLEPNTWTLWAKPVGEFIDQKSFGQNVGYSSDSYGGMIGTDRKLGGYFHLGAAAGYAYNHVHFKRSRGKAHSNNAYGALYAFWQQECFHMLASVIGGWNNCHGKREIKFNSLNRRAHHKNHGYIAAGQFETAYSINRKNTRVQPFGRAQYIYSTQDSYHEHGAGVLDLKVNRKNSDRFRSDLGLDFSQCFKLSCGQIVPSAYVSWAWEKEMKSGHMRATFIDFDCEMSVHAYRPVRSLFAPGAGLTGVFCGDRISVALRWDGEFGKRYSNQKALVEANFGF